jgi:hypothetical protein
MIAQKAFVASMQRASDLLISRGFDPVLPVEDCYISHYIPLHLAGAKGDNEVLCVKLRMVSGAVSLPYVESFCRYEICQFHSLLTIDPGNITLHCEVWVVSPNGSIHCFEVLRDEIREVAAYAR